MATNGTLPVRENSFMFNAPEGDVSIDDLIDAIEATAGEDSVLVLQHMGGSRFLVCARNVSQATRLIVAQAWYAGVLPKTFLCRGGTRCPHQSWETPPIAIAGPPPSNAQATTSGLQVLKPRSTHQLPKQPSPDWDNQEHEASRTASSPSEAHATLQASSDTDGATTVTVDSATEASSAENSRESWSDACSGCEEQEAPQIAEPPWRPCYAQASYRQRKLPAAAPCEWPRNPLGRYSDCQLRALHPPTRTRARRQPETNKSVKTERAGSQEMSPALRRPQGKVASSDRDAPPQAKAPKLGETPLRGKQRAARRSPLDVALLKQGVSR
ncbi:hypothetical protein MTO96_046994 [Rhipicephalus appendiculatus]